MPTSVLSRQRTWVSIFAVLAMIISLMAIAPAANAQVQDTSASCPDSIPSAGFTDLGGLDATTVQAIDCLVEYGISQGTSATTFSPTLSVPRWQMALFLTRQAAVHGVTLPDGSDQGFTDIGGLDAATQTAINQLAQLGITQGTSATTFSPLDLVSRWQMALFLTRLVDAAGVTLPDGSDQGYTDISGQSAEAQTAINQVTQLGIAQGTSATTFVPDAATLRWQMALFLTRTLAADGIRPSVAVGPSDAPQLISVSFDASDSDDTRLLFQFDEDVSLIGDEDDFVLVDPAGRIYEAQTGSVDKASDDSIEAVYDNDIVDVVTLGAVTRGAVENVDADPNPAGSAPYQSFTVDGFDLVGDDDAGNAGDNDAPELVEVVSGSFDDDDDTIELEFDQDMDDATFVEGSFLFVEEGGDVWVGVTGSADPDDEFVTIELNETADDLGAEPDDDDADDLVRVFLEPGAATNDGGVDNPPHSIDIRLSGETDEAPSLESVDVDKVDKEITFTFNRSIVDQAYTPAEFVLVAMSADGTVAIHNPSAAADLDRDSSRVIIWDTDDDGVVETANTAMILYVGVWDHDGDGATSIEDFATGDNLEVGHFVNRTYSFSSGTTAAPFPTQAVGDTTALGNDFEIDVTFSQDVDTATFVEADVWLFEDNGDALDPDIDDIDPDDEVVTYTILDGADGFDELDDGDVGVMSFDQGHATNAWGYESHPTSLGLS